MVAGAFSNNGTITGKINGTIEGGTGAPATYDNGTVLSKAEEKDSYA